MNHLVRDLRYAWRGLLRSPVFTIVALASMALGIGATTAIFTLVNEVLLRLLPVRQPEQLVLFNGARFHYGSNNGGNALSFPMYEDFRDNFVERGGAPLLPRVSQAVADPLPSDRAIFSGLFCRYATAFTVGFDGQSERIPGELVSGTYFSVLGVGAALGRVITPDDDRVPGGHPVAVLNYDYWRNRFGSDPNIVGKTLIVNGMSLTIIGVSAQGFGGLDIGNVVQVRVPMMMKTQMTPNWNALDDRRQRFVNVFGRLGPGISIDRAKTVLQPFFHNLLDTEVRMPAFRNASAFARERFLQGTMDLLPAAQGRSPLRQQLTQPLWLLMAIVATVLLIACANVASLLVARATSRQKEIAVRLALGASRGRLVSQLLAESLLLAALGGALGLLMAKGTSSVLLQFLPTSETPHAITASIDMRVMAFNFGLALVTGLLFGLAPAFRATRPNLAPTLKDQIGSVIGGGGGVTLRKALVVAQVTLSILLLVGAGLFIRTLRNLRLVDLGLRPESLVAFNVNPSLSGYTPGRCKQFYAQVVERLRGEPGVQSVAFANIAILEGNESDWSVTVEGYASKPGESTSTYFNAVSPAYFTTLGIPLLVGRDFDARDRSSPPATALPADSYKVVIVNESFARRYFGDASPIGRHMGLGSDPGTKTPMEIVGVVKDAKYTGVRDEIPRQMFIPYLEAPSPGSAVLYVRSTADPSAASGAARRVVRELDAGVPVYNLMTLERKIDRSLLVERLIATLATAFGVVATMLSLVGLYGVMAFTVAERTREIGVRMALGATEGNVLWLVMREVLLLVGSGLALGLGAAFAMSRLVRSQLYGVAPNDPLTIAVAAAVLGLVALAAGYIPARRAARVNPVLALRCE